MFLSKEILSSWAGVGVIGLSHETHSTFQKNYKKNKFEKKPFSNDSLPDYKNLQTDSFI